MWSRDKDDRAGLRTAWAVDDATDMGMGRNPTSNMGTVERARDMEGPWVASDRTSKVSKELFPIGLKIEDVTGGVGAGTPVEVVDRGGGNARGGNPSELSVNPLEGVLPSSSGCKLARSKGGRVNGTRRRLAWMFGSVLDSGSVTVCCCSSRL